MIRARLNVLIESDWNLKAIAHIQNPEASIVLIESDWNLKQDNKSQSYRHYLRINRIRLEFKVPY